MMLASVQRSIGLAMVPLLILGFGFYIFVNFRKARPELGSEIELAPNRKPYFDDEVLEGPRLDRFLTWALVLMSVLAVGLPAYWIAEPGRQSGAITAGEKSFVKRGKAEFTANCQSCHAKGATGVLHAASGLARLDLESADIAGVPIPKVLLQQIVTFYSRSPEHPSGIDLDDPLPLPAGIRELRVEVGRAIVVQ